jgi:hypothetical protein
MGSTLGSSGSTPTARWAYDMPAACLPTQGRCWRACCSHCWLSWAPPGPVIQGSSPLPCVQVAAELGKPLVLEEFGKNSGEGNITSVRDPCFGLVQGAVDASLQSGGPLRGALFWQWDGETGPRIDVGSNIREVRGSGAMKVWTTCVRFKGCLTEQDPACHSRLPFLRPAVRHHIHPPYVSPFAHKLAVPCAAARLPAPSAPPVPLAATA